MWRVVTRPSVHIPHSLDAVGPAPTSEVLEFYTTTPPTYANPGQSSVAWSLPEGETLDIVLSRIAETDGSVTIFE